MMRRLIYAQTNGRHSLRWQIPVLLCQFSEREKKKKEEHYQRLECDQSTNNSQKKEKSNRKFCVPMRTKFIIL